MEYIYRAISDSILEAIQYYSVITITGPRQVGKTTLCKNLFPDYEYINLERPSHGNNRGPQSKPRLRLFAMGRSSTLEILQKINASPLCAQKTDFFPRI